jgi:Zn-dependent peptidase ImmA (M78 family)
MPHTPHALITPELLAWARRTRGFEIAEAAVKLGIPSDRLAAWEDGVEQPSIGQARKMAELYKRPLAVFFLSEPPKDFQPLRDFRRLSGLKEPPTQSSQLAREIRRAEQIREAAVSLLDEDEFRQRPELPGSPSDPPEELASRVRALFDVTYQAQTSWRDPFKALHTWRDAIELKGIFVTQAKGVEVDEMRAFSISDSPLPMIVLNSKDSATSRIFSLLHEFVHILMNLGGVCQWARAELLQAEDRAIEVLCNHLSGAALVPANQLLSHPLVLSRPGMVRWSEEDLREVARNFSVSQEVILRRFLLLGRTTEDYYQEMREEFLRQYERLRESSTPPIVSYEKRIVNSLGKAYIELVLGSYYENRISLSAVSDYLGVRVKHIPSIETEIMGWSLIRGFEP